MTHFSCNALWLDALLLSYFARECRVNVGVTFRSAVRWRPHMRDHVEAQKACDGESLDEILAITHLIYTVTRYNTVRVSGHDFAPEQALLKQTLPLACARGDLEVVAEIVESLRILDEPLDDDDATAALELLRSSQNSDGSWGHRRKSWYTRYHTTWTCLDALRPYKVAGGRGWRHQRRMPRSQSCPP